MDCRHCEEQFSALLEGSPSGSGAGLQASREHLAACPACQAHYEAFRETVGQLRTLPLVAPPPRLRAEIAAALDAVAVPVPAPRFAGYWQPLTAATSLVACLMVVLWTVVLSPPNALPGGSGSLAGGPGLVSSAAPTGLLAPAPQPPGPMAAAGGVQQQPGPQTRPERRGAAGHAAGPRYARQPGRAAATAAGSPLPADFGHWGSRVASLPAPAAANGDKPAGTFALEPGESAAEGPLQKTPGELQLAFTPPQERVVGTLAVGQLVVTSEAQADITIRLQPQGELRVTNARGGVLYAGPIRKDEALRLPVRMIAARPGRQRLQVTVASDVPGVATELPLVLPAFGEPAAAAEFAAVTLVFKETPSVRAIRELAAAAGARVVIAEGLTPQLVTQDFSAGVPFRVALRVLCESCGYQLEERGGVFHILK